MQTAPSADAVASGLVFGAVRLSQHVVKHAAAKADDARRSAGCSRQHGSVSAPAAAARGMPHGGGRWGLPGMLAGTPPDMTMRPHDYTSKI